MLRNGRLFQHQCRVSSQYLLCQAQGCFACVLCARSSGSHVSCRANPEYCYNSHSCLIQLCRAVRRKEGSSLGQKKKLRNAERIVHECIAHSISWQQQKAKLSMRDGMIKQVLCMYSASTSHHTLTTACICIALAICITSGPMAVLSFAAFRNHCCSMSLASGHLEKSSHVTGQCVLSSICFYAERRRCFMVV